MAISLAAALKSVKEDEKWVKKTIIGGLVFLVYVMVYGIPSHCKTLWVNILATIAGVLLWLYLTGFSAKTGNKMLETGTNKMSEWFESNQLLAGFKYILGSAIFGFCLGLIGFLFAISAGFIFGALLGCHSGVAVDMFLKAFMAVFGIVLGLYLAQFINVMVLSFYKSMKIRDMLAFKRHFIIIKENAHASWTLLGKCILFALLSALIFAVCAVTIVGVIAVPFLYFALVIAGVNLLVQYGRHIDIGKYME